LTEYCILPLGFDSISDAIPKINSILLFGPKGVGKNAYVNAIATETGATLFNLSPRNTMGQYPGKAGVVKMLHMVFKVAEACAPSIIYINEAEMVFAKKVPKDNPSDPKRIKKLLIKYAKKLKGKILLIGTSYKPWDILYIYFYYLKNNFFFFFLLLFFLTDYIYIVIRKVYYLFSKKVS